MKTKAVPRECRGTPVEQAPLKTFTSADAEDLRHQMYMYCINFNFCRNKDEAKLLLKKFGFLTKGGKNDKRN